MIVEAPAKVNLSLRVLRRRDDGFHEIDTLMVRLPGLADRLTFTGAVSRRGRRSLHGADVAPDTT